MDASGILAALVAPLSMTIGFVIWDDQWHGSAFALNLFKCTLASAMFLLTVGSIKLAGASGWSSWALGTVGWLVISSMAGIVIGDNTWLFALELLGSRKVA